MLAQGCQACNVLVIADTAISDWLSVGVSTDMLWTIWQPLVRSCQTSVGAAERVAGRTTARIADNDEQTEPDDVRVRSGADEPSSHWGDQEMGATPVLSTRSAVGDGDIDRPGRHRR